MPVEVASRIREGITSTMNSNTRAELRRQINGRCAKRAAQYDSVTGTSSPIHVNGILQPPASISEDGEDSTYASAEEYLPSRGESPSGLISRGNSEIGKFSNSPFYAYRINAMLTPSHLQLILMMT